MQAYREWLPIRMPDPANPQKIYRSFDFGSLASLHMLDTRLIGRDQQVSLDTYLAGGADRPTRQLLGAEQSDWLSARMAASGATWQVLGQQVLMARMEIPLSVASAFTAADPRRLPAGAIDARAAAQRRAARAAGAAPRALQPGRVGRLSGRARDRAGRGPFDGQEPRLAGGRHAQRMGQQPDRRQRPARRRRVRDRLDQFAGLRAAAAR